MNKETYNKLLELIGEYGHSQWCFGGFIGKDEGSCDKCAEKGKAALKEILSILRQNLDDEDNS